VRDYDWYSWTRPGLRLAQALYLATVVPPSLTCVTCRPLSNAQVFVFLLTLTILRRNSTTKKTRMWANAQRDGRPTEYRWRPLFNAAKFGWRPVLDCRAVTLPRRESRWNLQGCPKLANRSQPLVCRSSPYYEDVRRRYRCLTSFFPIVDTCLSCEDTARQSCPMVPKWQFFASCICSEPRAAHFRHAV